MGVDTKILNPIDSWKDKDDFKQEVTSLANKFIINMKKYESQTPAEVIAKGGPNMNEF